MKLPQQDTQKFFSNTIGRKGGLQRADGDCFTETSYIDWPRLMANAGICYVIYCKTNEQRRTRSGLSNPGNSNLALRYMSIRLNSSSSTCTLVSCTNQLRPVISAVYPWCPSKSSSCDCFCRTLQFNDDAIFAKNLGRDEVEVQRLSLISGGGVSELASYKRATHWFWLKVTAEQAFPKQNAIAYHPFRWPGRSQALRISPTWPTKSMSAYTDGLKQNHCGQGMVPDAEPWMIDFLPMRLYCSLNEQNLERKTLTPSWLLNLSLCLSPALSIRCRGFRHRETGRPWSDHRQHYHNEISICVYLLILVISHGCPLDCISA